MLALIVLFAALAIALPLLVHETHKSKNELRDYLNYEVRPQLGYEPLRESPSAKKG